MHVFGAFELDIRPGTPDNPAGVKIALLRYTRGEDSRLFITPECSSFEEVEGQINSLQGELDEIRERARRAFQVS
jgi:hypothetical protein